MTEYIRKGKDRTLEVHRDGELEYLTFPLLDRADMVHQLFSTRMGGVSQGIFSTMNLSFTRGDEESAVLENYRRIACALGDSVENMVCSDQTHTTNIRKVTAKDRGKGIIKPKDYRDVDGLITNVPELILCTSYADCVPLYFVDPVNRAIGLSHSGWRGTVNRMGEKTLLAMKEAYGTKPEDCLCAIGPSICQDCYEVSEDVAAEFRICFGETEPFQLARRDGKSKIQTKAEADQDSESSEPLLQQILKKQQEPGKYLLDLWKANHAILTKAGVPEENIAVTDICTCCNSEYLFSHRASQGKRGNLGAFLSIMS